MRNQLFLGAAVAALVMPAVAGAQETTSIIRGTVVSAGAPVAGAKITITHVPSGTRSTSTTDGNGSFAANGLRVGGPYTVEVSSDKGTTSISGIYTVVQQPYDLPIDLGGDAAASGAAEIVVTAASIKGAGVTSDGPQTILTQADIAKVASVNRDIRDIERRDPFANIDLSNGGDRGGAVSFAGVNPRFNRFTINGVTVGDTFGLNQDASPTNRGPVPFDALAQVSVSIAPYDFRQSGFQGGAIDTVLASGTNRFHGTGFYSQNTDGLSGDRIGNTTIVNPKYKSETYGATLSGPIIRDKLFFLVSGEKNTDPRPFSTQVAQVPGLTQGAIDNVTSIANSVYNIDAGSSLVINPRKDEKIVGRIDWNITDGQRLSVSYINAYDSLVSQNNTSTSNTAPQYGLSTNAYALTELLRAGIVQLNSDWTDRFSTEVRGIYKWTRRGQEPLGGRPNGQLQVCNEANAPAIPTSSNSNTGCASGTPRITFGPDNFRQTNVLFFDTWEGSFLGRYRAGSHELKALIDVTQNRTFNNFVPNSLGSWYFDSLADFQAQRANSVQYAAVIGGAENGAAADFNYTQFTFGLQDDWQVTDKLKVTYGARATLFDQHAQPVANPFFLSRSGFPNTFTYKGQFQFEPRVGFDWKATPRLKIRGGAGVFSGGSPDIFLSNSFSNTITTSALTITRAAATAGNPNPNTCTNNVPDAVCQAALNNVTGAIPAVVAAYVADPNNSSTLPRTNTGALAPNFKLPSSLKATLSGDYKLFGVNFGADFYYSKVIEGVVFRDARSVVVGTLADGRPRYNGITAFSDNNVDVITANDSRGRSFVGVIRADKKFDFGLSLGGSYTVQDVRDAGNATSSTITSNYRNQLYSDPNRAAYGISADQTSWSFKYNIGFDHSFFGDYRTAFQLFGETRAGRRYSYTFFDNTNNRSTVFGTNLANTSTVLLYVPTGANDPRISYADTTSTTNGVTTVTQTAAQAQSLFDTFINGTALGKYRGQVAPKNIARSRAFTRIDLHLEQEIPTFVGKSRFTVFADIINLPNLLNKNWGGLSQFGFPYGAAVIGVQCANAAGTPLTGAIGSGTNPSGGCAKYVYSNFRAPNDAVVNVTQSLYQIRVGARFTF
ncbi:MAG: carboxypeptidase regulatory-like domain-containing protein [Sphingomonas sp.]|jgi:hypothetical protein